MAATIDSDLIFLLTFKFVYGFATESGCITISIQYTHIVHQTSHKTNRKHSHTSLYASSYPSGFMDTMMCNRIWFVIACIVVFPWKKVTLTLTDRHHAVIYKAHSLLLCDKDEMHVGAVPAEANALWGNPWPSIHGQSNTGRLSAPYSVN